MKKKYVADKNCIDPLSAYKKGVHWQSATNLTNIKQSTNNVYVSEPNLDMPAIVGGTAQKKTS